MQIVFAMIWSRWGLPTYTTVHVEAVAFILSLGLGFYTTKKVFLKKKLALRT